MKNNPSDKRDPRANKPHYDKPQSRTMTPPRVSARMSRRAIPRSK